MALKRAADHEHREDSETLPGGVVDAKGKAGEEVPGSVDKLLELTDEGWDIEAQGRALKSVAGARATKDRPRPAARIPSVAMPTPFELGAITLNAADVESIDADEVGPASGSGPHSSPPPLPVPGKSSKIPPPLPSSPPSGDHASARAQPSRPPARSVPAPPISRRPPPLPRNTPDPPSVRPARPAHDPVTSPGALIDLLTARVASLASSDDTVARARAHIELSVAYEMAGDDARSTQQAEAALGVDPSLAAAHAILRRRKHGRGAIAQMLAHLEHEIEAATSEAASVELLAEKARLVDALGDKPETARTAWEAALTRAPNHSAALKGLESELFMRATSNDARGDALDALATHLGRMADAYASSSRLAAWLHVERAQILEHRLDRVDAARGAYDKAIALDPSVGPVRAAFVRHAAANHDPAALCTLLSGEASIETDPTRAARLELDAACLAATQLRDVPRAILLLERAAGRAPTVASVDLRVLDELVNLHEAAGEWLEASRARRTRLAFISEPAALAFELRALALVEERLGHLDVAIADIQRALAVDTNDPTLVDLLDRLLDAAKKQEQRVALWVTEAARTDETARRAKALIRAAQLSENVLGRPEEAVRHLRAAWVASPGDSEILDHLARLLAPSPSESVDGEVRSLAELYAQAAQKASDPVRRVAYLERVALLWEDLLGDQRRAARAYEDVLAAVADHRGAILGLSRTAARIGDEKALARALLDEARLAHDGVDVLALKTRAAAALSKVDAARALALVDDVIRTEPAHTSARALETRLHEDAGRWELAAKSYRSRIEHALRPTEKLSLWLALAQLQEARLRAPLDALESLQAARVIDPSHPVPPVEIARVLGATGNDRALRFALGDLAKSSRSPGERARYLVRAAELDELRLDDDVSAADHYARALEDVPDDELVADRLARVLARRAKVAERDDKKRLAPLASHVAARLDRAVGTPRELGLKFDLASLLVQMGTELPRATQILESVLEEQPNHVGALRLTEHIARRTHAWAPLARVLSRQGEELVDARARLGALWALASLEEWRLPVSDTQSTYARILELDPTDPGALESLVRREGASARRGDSHARRAVVGALGSLCAIAPDDSTRLALELRLAMLLEAAGSEAGDSSGPQIARDALERYRNALTIDPLSVTGATGLARLATRLADAFGAVAASMSLADLAAQPKARARYLVDAAEMLLGPDDDMRLGARDERRTRAVGLLEKALDADPDSLPAAGRLSQLRSDSGEGEGLVNVFQVALGRASNADAIVMLGSEIARVARDELSDLNLAIDAMRKVREAAPGHVPSLLTLAELCIAQRSWPEAVEALEAVVSKSRETEPRLTALFALASVYDKVLARPADAERALRTALTIDPENPRALRALLHKLASTRQSATAQQREEMADLLERLAEAEHEAGPKCEILLELADMRMQLGDPHGAERALTEAVAQAPDHARAFARLAALFRTPQGRDHAGYARALSHVISRGQILGRVDPRWLATIGQIEVESLHRVRDGVAHMQRAVQMDATLYETRFELAQAFAKMGANEEASRTLMAMMTPSSRPLAALADPGAGLALLERVLGAERRTEEALVISELRAIAGDLDDGRHAWLRARRLPAHDSHHGSLDRPTLVTHVLPPEGRHVLLEVAAAVMGIEAKMLRADLSELGISSRDRVGARAGTTTRGAFDRIMRALGLSDVELVISPSVTRVRVLAQDEPWVVVPKPLSDLPEPTQLAAMGRAMARIAFGVPWLEELPPPHIEALLVAAARQVSPGYASESVDVIAQKLVATYEPNVARALTRRQKKLLEELAPHIQAPQGRPPAIETFIGCLARAELRVAYLLSGDLLATIDELRGLDSSFLRSTEAAGPGAVSAVLDHAFAGDVARFALTAEATGLRRRIATTWTG